MPTVEFVTHTHMILVLKIHLGTLFGYVKKLSTGFCARLLRKKLIRGSTMPFLARWWNSERVEKLKQLWNEGISARKVADVLHCNRNAVIGKAHRLELPPRKLPAKPKPRPEKIVEKVVMVKKPIVEPSKDTITASSVPFMELQDHHCRFIVGEGDDKLAIYCGE